MLFNNNMPLIKISYDTLILLKKYEIKVYEGKRITHDTAIKQLLNEAKP